MNLENDPQNYTETKLNHSGNAPEAMREIPENDFDNTSLQEAVNQGLITVPETTEAVGRLRRKAFLQSKNLSPPCLVRHLPLVLASA